MKIYETAVRKPISTILIFVGVIVFTFRPGGKKTADEAASIPLKED